MPLNIQVKIPMVEYGIQSISSGATKFERTQTPLDDGDYDGATYYFEVNGWNTHATIDYFIRLIDSSDTVLATITIPATTGNSGSVKRFRSTSFTPTSGAETYRCQTEQTAATGNVGCRSAFIVIDQVAATKTRLPIQPSFRLGQNASDLGSGYLEANGDTSYNDLISQGGVRFTKDDAWYDGYTAIKWEMEATASPNAGNGDVRVLNHDTSGEVGSLNFTVSSIVTKTLDITGDGDWVDGDGFRFQHRKNVSASMRTYKCMIYVTLTGGLTKARVFHPISHQTILSTGIDSLYRDFYESSKWDSHTIKHVGGGFETADGRVADLYDFGTDDDPSPSGTVVSGSSLDFGVSPSQWVETSAVTLTANNRYGVRGAGSAGFINLLSHIAYDVTGAAAPGVDVADDLNNWADDLEDPVQQEKLNSTAAENFNAWADAVVVNPEVFLSSSAAEDMDNWGDSVAVKLNVFLRADVNDSMNFWADSIGFPVSGKFFGRDVLIFADIFLDTGQISVSNIPIRHPLRFYDGRVIRFGTIVRSIPVPSGLNRIGDASLLLADTDQKFRKIFAIETPKKRIVEIKIVPVGEPFALAQRLYKGEIVNITFPEGAADIELADITFDFLRDEIPSLINPDNFTSLPENFTQGFAPIVIGEVFSEALPFQGVLECPHVDTINHRYMVARHHIELVAVVYRRQPGEADFSIIFTGFQVIEEIQVIDSVTYNFIYIQFFVAQPDGTEIRADVKGWTVDDTADTLIEQNPARNIRNYLTRIVGIPNDNTKMNIVSFDLVETKTTTLLYKCDGAITEPMTHGEALSKIYSSFNIDFFQNKDGLIEITLVTTSDINRPLYGDVLRILEETIDQTLANPVYNVIRYQFDRNYADREWGFEKSFVNDTDQIAIGEDIELPVELWFARDKDTAANVAADIASYFDLTSFRISLDLPAPWVVDTLELARLIGVTHYGGIEQSGEGYVNQEFKITGLDLDVDNLRYRVDAIIRRGIPAVSEGVFEGNWANNSIVGPYMPRTGTFYGVFIEGSATPFNKLIVVVSTDFGLHWTQADSVNRPELTNIITSFDSYWDEGKDLLLEIATQEAVTGRVAYHRFDMAQGRWKILDDEVVASPGVGAGIPFVSITKTRQSKKLVIFYRDDDVAGASDPFLFRQKAVIKLLGGTWGTPFFVGSENCQGSYFGNRVVAGKEDLIHFFYMFRGSNLEGYGTERIEDRFLTLDNTGSSLGEFIRFSGNVVYYHSLLPYGVPAVKEDASGEVLIDIPTQGFLGHTQSFGWTSATQMEPSFKIAGNCNAGFLAHLAFAHQPELIAVSNAFQGIGGTDGQTLYSAITLMKNFTKNLRYSIWPAIFDNVTFKQIVGDARPTSMWQPGPDQGFNLKAGPTWLEGGLGLAMQKMNARLYTINNVDYIAYFLNAGMLPSESAALVAKGALPQDTVTANFFRWIKVTDLPEAPELTRATFIQGILDVF